MTPQLDKKRIYIFLAFAFGISWLTALFIYLRGGLAHSRVLTETGITEAFLLITFAYMFAPAIANILTRLITKEGKSNLQLYFNFRNGRRFWLITWLGTPLLMILGAVVYFSTFSVHFDADLSNIRNAIMALSEQSGEPFPLSPAALIGTQLLLAIVISPFVNALPILGEEFGWRAYLQPKLMALGARKAMIWMGVIWGVWHWPLIAMGHNYGLDYPGAPWLGMLAMTWFTFVFGTFLGWLTIRGGSVWPAVIGHGLLNGLGGMVFSFTNGTPIQLFGPSVAGVVGGIGFTIVAAWLFFSKQLTDLDDDEFPELTLASPEEQVF